MVNIEKYKQMSTREEIPDTSVVATCPACGNEIKTPLYVVVRNDYISCPHCKREYNVLDLNWKTISLRKKRKKTNLQQMALPI